MTVEAVAFDYGGVLTTPVRDSIRAWLARDGIEPASFSRALKAWLSRDAAKGTPIHLLETGRLTIPEFEALLAPELITLDGTPVDADGLLQRLFADMRPDTSMFALAADLKAAGLRVAMVSNSWGSTYPREQIDALFSPVVISGEVGMRKPNRDIFEHTLALLDLPADRVVFVDDAQPNTDGAARVGMQTILHVDAGLTRKDLGRLVPQLDKQGANT